MPRSLESALTSRGRSRARVDCHETHTLSARWQAACSPAQPAIGAGELEALSWIPARVPGTAAGALRDAGLWHEREPHDFDAQDWWFRTDFDEQPVTAGEEVSLRLDGIATVAEVYPQR